VSDEFTPEIAAKAIAQIRAETPEGYDWRVGIQESFGFHRFSVTLTRRGWLNFPLAQWSDSWKLGDNGDGILTPEEFEESVIAGALLILEERSKYLNTPDWAKLAKSLQAALNGKTA
jgi:hypothetical protein